ncbi:MAG TPA: helix-turn-helix domain-containing protein [Steroidobacteraceae bacterium]|jgi:DNA-binding HxlR family transcriptional regulator|nr:helix-turn-helix domain-containing protein [Steroidobacteraceae bacterium]
MPMQHKNLSDRPCPIARSLERVGEWWSILILRDAFQGVSRFDHFQKSLGIAPNMLTRRLKTLTDSGLLERRLYSEKPPRYEYVLTDRGRDFLPVIWALVVWGNKHFSPEGEHIRIADAKTGELADPAMIDRRTGRVLASADFKIITGPAASERLKLRYQDINRYFDEFIDVAASSANPKGGSRKKTAKKAGASK